jgi:archaemetzincin
MFSMLHCTAWTCCMCGANHQAEKDARPLEVCPECVAKVWWATGVAPLGRFRGLASICRRLGLEDEARFCEASARALAPAKGRR